MAKIQIKFKDAVIKEVPLTAGHADHRKEGGK